MLAFGIRYLNGFVAARTAPDDLQAEWPPHPGRVFMALAAAHFQTGAAPEEREALLWLQSLNNDGEPAAPLIVASEIVQRAVVTHFVPVNDKPGPSKAMLQSAPLTRERQPRSFARAWLDDDVVYMAWLDAEPDRLIRKALEILCAIEASNWSMRGHCRVQYSRTASRPEHGHHPCRWPRRHHRRARPARRPCPAR